MADDCIFCRILAGAIPSTRVHEDEQTIAFMDIGPIVRGHVLVIPRAHSENLLDTAPEVLAHMMRTARRIAQAQVEGLGADGINLTLAHGAVAGQEVPHIHLHVIPRFRDDGHRWNWNAKRYENNDQMAEVAQRIRSAL